MPRIFRSGTKESRRPLERTPSSEDMSPSTSSQNVPIRGLPPPPPSSGAGASSSSSSRDEARGTVLKLPAHTVVVDRKLAEGGFAVVYLVTDKKGARFALKRQRIANDDARQVDACRMEAHVLSNLRGHKNIVEYRDHMLLRKSKFTDYMLLTEYHKRSVLEWMSSRAKDDLFLTSAEVLAVFCDVIKACARLHHSTTPLIHRDLKVENVLVDDRPPGRPTYVLCDFGSTTTKVMSLETHAAAELEEEISRYTTPAYRAPEMVDFYMREPIDTRSDIWALGVLLFRLSYFTLPFGESALAVHNGVYALPTRPADVSDDVKAIIKFLLEPRPSHRPNIFQLSGVVFEAAGGDASPIANIYKVSPIALCEVVAAWRGTGPPVDVRRRSAKPPSVAPTAALPANEQHPPPSLLEADSTTLATRTQQQTPVPGTPTARRMTETSVNPRLRPRPTPRTSVSHQSQADDAALAPPPLSARDHSSVVDQTPRPSIASTSSLASGTAANNPFQDAPIDLDQLEEMMRTTAVTAATTTTATATTTTTNANHHHNHHQQQQQQQHQPAAVARSIPTDIRSAFKPYSQSGDGDGSGTGRRPPTWNPFAGQPNTTAIENGDENSGGGGALSAASLSTSVADSTTAGLGVLELSGSAAFDVRSSRSPSSSSSSSSGSTSSSLALNLDDPFSAAPFEPQLALLLRHLKPDVAAVAVAESRRRKQHRSHHHNQQTSAATATRSSLAVRRSSELESDADSARMRSRRRLSYEHFDGVGEDAHSEATASSSSSTSSSSPSSTSPSSSATATSCSSVASSSSQSSSDDNDETAEPTSSNARKTRHRRQHRHHGKKAKKTAKSTTETDGTPRRQKSATTSATLNTATSSAVSSPPLSTSSSSSSVSSASLLAELDAPDNASAITKDTDATSTATTATVRRPLLHDNDDNDDEEELQGLVKAAENEDEKNGAQDGPQHSAAPSPPPAVPARLPVTNPFLSPAAVSAHPAAPPPPPHRNRDQPPPPQPPQRLIPNSTPASATLPRQSTLLPPRMPPPPPSKTPTNAWTPFAASTPVAGPETPTKFGTLVEPATTLTTPDNQANKSRMVVDDDVEPETPTRQQQQQPVPTANLTAASDPVDDVVVDTDDSGAGMFASNVATLTHSQKKSLEKKARKEHEKSSKPLKKKTEKESKDRKKREKDDEGAKDKKKDKEKKKKKKSEDADDKEAGGSSSKKDKEKEEKKKKKEDKEKKEEKKKKKDKKQTGAAAAAAMQTSFVNSGFSQ